MYFTYCFCVSVSDFKQTNTVGWWTENYKTFPDILLCNVLFWEKWASLLLPHIKKDALHKKLSFQLRISSVHVNQICGFGHIYWRNPSWKTSFFVQCNIFLKWDKHILAVITNDYKTVFWWGNLEFPFLSRVKFNNVFSHENVG